MHRVTKVQYFTACTIDGYIADENHSLAWLFEVPHDDEDVYWEEWFPSIGGLVMGATTYEWLLEHEGPGSWRRYYGDRPGWIFTHHDLPKIPEVDITFAEGDVRPAYEEIVQRLGGANLWLVGGGDLVGQFHDAGLLDEIILGMTPVTLGRGAPLLPRQITSTQLAFRSADLVGQRVRIVLAVQRQNKP
jgi:dihydrofolate reductase